MYRASSRWSSATKRCGGLIVAASNLKHQTALSVAYGAGLRAKEVVALKIGDIESQRMMRRVEHGSRRGINGP